MSAPNNIAALIAERAQILQWLKPAQEREMEIRLELARHFVPEPKEGTNRIEKDGYEVVVVHKLTRKLDEPALDSVMPQMPEPFRQLGVLIKYNPALVLDGYRALPEEAQKVFEQALTITESAPALDIKTTAAEEQQIEHKVAPLSAETKQAVLQAAKKVKAKPPAKKKSKK